MYLSISIPNSFILKVDCHLGEAFIDTQCLPRKKLFVSYLQVKKYLNPLLFSI